MSATPAKNHPWGNQRASVQKCEDCKTRFAEDRAGRFCLTCLRERIADETPIEKVAVCEQRGRKIRSLAALDGCPGTDEE